ncbi:hypothetical protein [Streptomyces vinaceus]|uniref:hypothetical protein n=1 Tax=Streptomyces vinaceus TaxID=1960 RepID=UPI0036C5C59C
MNEIPSGSLLARNHIAARLITRHGLDPLDAHTAVTRVHLGLPTEHEHLVRQEARAIIDELQQALTEAFAPIAAAMRSLGEAVARAVEQLPQPPAAGARPRPAWQSPYGPPRKGHRR